eukprot:Gregarina_sp_Pseudo_9__1162@NODE_1766_length_1344_cov_3_201533_g1636_i0_p2_GENE_NODE_1766_length_1344_cov_3_201533_g1636_i0NODE_1766_length_1344_cov_3_201533_g1636_i0_p2_ORF_typecomplete_len130_score13_04_NODE_1766_length_1344_cov_3_201533_g1636_i0498887
MHLDKKSCLTESNALAKSVAITIHLVLVSMTCWSPLCSTDTAWHGDLAFLKPYWEVESVVGDNLSQHWELLIEAATDVDEPNLQSPRLASFGRRRFPACCLGAVNFRATSIVSNIGVPFSDFIASSSSC